MAGDDGDWIRSVDTALMEWRQGDCCLDDEWFVHRFDPTIPLTQASRDLVSSGDTEAGLVEEQVKGMMIATQSCDVVRSCVDRPYIEICPLVELSESILSDVKRGRRPQYAFVPGVESHRLAADLDRVMTVEKAIVSSWLRTPGCNDAESRRRLASALARKRVRVAFPDDFVAFAVMLQSMIGGKKAGKSSEGRAIRSLREIRVRAAPSWDAPRIELFFWFIREIDDEDFEGKSWAELCEGWLGLAPASGRYVEVEGSVVTISDLTAKDYIESDPLDLDHLSA